MVKNKLQNKNDLIWYLRKYHHLTLKDAKAIVNGLFNYIQDQVVNGNHIQITKFGKFGSIENKEKIITLQGQQYSLKVLKSVNFKPSKNFNKKFRKEYNNEKNK